MTDEISDLRNALQAAENAGDPDGILALFSDDVVAMVPSAPAIEGRAACAEFVRETLGELLARYDRRVEYVSAEVDVIGDLAYDRGTFSMETVLRENGEHFRAAGKYFWLLRRDAGLDWRIARLIHSLDEEDEAGPPGAPEEIETARLRLVRPRPADAREVFERYAGDADVTRYLGWPRHRSVADTEAFLAFSDEQWARWPAGPYLIRSRDDNRLLGSTGLGFESPDRASTGYVLAKDAWGRGYATEALRAMVSLAAELGVATLYAICHPDHRASRHVLEKCGFTRSACDAPHAEFPNHASGGRQAILCYARKP